MFRENGSAARKIPRDATQHIRIVTPRRRKSKPKRLRNLILRTTWVASYPLSILFIIMVPRAETWWPFIGMIVSTFWMTAMTYANE